MFYGADGRPWFPLEEHRRDVPLSRISAHLQRRRRRRRGSPVPPPPGHRSDRHWPRHRPRYPGRAHRGRRQHADAAAGAHAVSLGLARFHAKRQRSRARADDRAAAVEDADSRAVSQPYLSRRQRLRRRGDVAERVRQAGGRSTLAESAFIAGLIRMPSALWPWSHYDRALQRSHVVLGAHAGGAFHHAQAEQAGARRRHRVSCPSGADTRRVRLRRGLSSPTVQSRVRRRQPAGLEGPDDVRSGDAEGSRARRLAGAARKFRQTGASGCARRASIRIPAMCSRSSAAATSSARRSTARPNAKRQPGSAFKPFVYAAALEGGMSPVSRISGLNSLRVPGYDEWEVRNASSEHTRHADASRSAVRIEQSGGRQAANADRLAAGASPGGFGRASRRMPDVPSLALGVGEATPLQLTAAYAVFPNGGFAVAPRSIVQVLDNDEHVAFNKPVERKLVLSEAVGVSDGLDARLTSSMSGTGAAARSFGVRFPAGGKTGTTDEFKDAWFIGFSSSVVVGVWVGIRSAGDDWSRRLRRAVRVADLGRFHVERRAPAKTRGVSSAHDCRRRSSLPRQLPPPARRLPDLHRSTSSTATALPRTGATSIRGRTPLKSSAPSFPGSAKGSGGSSADETRGLNMRSGDFEQEVRRSGGVKSVGVQSVRIV